MFAYAFALVERVRAERALLMADRKGVTALEYGLLAALIAGVIVTAVTTLGTTIQGVFTTVAGDLAPAG